MKEVAPLWPRGNSCQEEGDGWATAGTVIAGSTTPESNTT